MLILFTEFILLSQIKIYPSFPPVKKPFSLFFIYKQLMPFLWAFFDLVNIEPEHINKFPVLLPQIKISFKYPQHIIAVISEPFNPVHLFFFIEPFAISKILTSLTPQQANFFPDLLKHIPKILALPIFPWQYKYKDNVSILKFLSFKR